MHIRKLELTAPKTFFRSSGHVTLTLHIFHIGTLLFQYLLKMCWYITL